MRPSKTCCLLDLIAFCRIANHNVSPFSGRRHGPDVCPHASTEDQNCHATESVSIVTEACRGQGACSVGASNEVFGDPCGGTYKYLTVDYECLSAASLAALPPPPAPVGPPESLVPFNEVQMDTCYQLRARDFDVVMHEEPGDGSCSDGDAIYAQTGGRADSFKFVPPLCTDGGQCGDPNDQTVVSIESCQSPGRFLRHCNFHIWAGEFGTGPNYDFTWKINAGSDGVSVQLRTTADQFGARDMEVIPGADHRVTMVEDGNHENWYLVPAHSEAEVALGLVGCFQDCSSDGEGNTADRVCDEMVADVQSVEQCQIQCTEGSYAYMGMACPRAGAFECWCCNDLDENSAGRHSLIPTQECSGGELTSGVNENRQDHCSGFSGADGGYVLDGYYLGGHCRAAIYEMAALAPGELPPMALLPREANALRAMA